MTEMWQRWTIAGVLSCGCQEAQPPDRAATPAPRPPAATREPAAARDASPPALARADAATAPAGAALAPAEAAVAPAVDAAAPVSAAASAAVAESSPPPPLSEVQRAALLAGDEERIVSKREHFTVSNEYRHDLWFPYVRGLGGAYVGVASDQNYTLMAVARSEVGYLLDLDRQVVRLHRVYMALIAASPDPDAFLARFAEAARRDTEAVLQAGLSDMSARDRAEALQFVADNRAALREYLTAVKATRRGEQGVTWLADPELYRYIRGMVAGGRLRALNGNLAGKTAMATIAASARELGLTINLLYLSNAEEYLFYTPGFVANVRALPGGPDSVVLRTIHDRFEGWESCGEGDRRWNYQVQPLADFQTRLADRRNTARTAMLARATEAGAIHRVARGVSVFKRAEG